MYGAGACVFAVWTWVIANKDENGIVEINPIYLANTLGEPVKNIEQAIEYLCNPDPRSRTKLEEGRRLIRTGEFEHKVVTHEVQEQRGKNRNEYWREYRAKKRAETAKSEDCSQDSCDVHSEQVNSSQKFTHVDVTVHETASVKKEKDFVDKSTDLASEFERARVLYPGTKLGQDPEYKNFIKVCKKGKLKPSEVVPLLIPAIEKQIAWRELANGEFRPQWKGFSAWINQMFWTAEFPTEHKAIDKSIPSVENWAADPDNPILLELFPNLNDSGE